MNAEPPLKYLIHSASILTVVLTLYLSVFYSSLFDDVIFSSFRVGVIISVILLLSRYLRGHKL